jgi:hypothetical protein
MVGGRCCWVPCAGQASDSQSFLQSDRKSLLCTVTEAVPFCMPLLNLLTQQLRCSVVSTIDQHLPNHSDKEGPADPVMCGTPIPQAPRLSQAIQGRVATQKDAAQDCQTS